MFLYKSVPFSKLIMYINESPCPIGEWDISNEPVLHHWPTYLFQEQYRIINLLIKIHALLPIYTKHFIKQIWYSR